MPHPRVEVHRTDGPRSSLWHVYRHVGFWRVVWNTGWILTARYMPSFRLKNWMLRRTGATVHRSAAFGFESTIDILYPQRIRVEADATIGYDATLLCHAYLRDHYQVGDVSVRRGASIGARALVLPGVTVGEDAVVGAGSVVTRDVPAGEFWAGVPARRVDRSAEA